jgi:hypothetical protein
VKSTNPPVQRIEIDGAPILTYAVYAAPAMSEVDLSWFIDDTVSRALQGEKRHRPDRPRRRREPRDQRRISTPTAWPASA